ncbi:MAG: acyl carrier protein [Gammaproteobacteria bacterium]
MTHDNNDITGQLCQRLSHLTESKIEIEPDMNLIDTLALDSMKVLNLVMEIEDEFDISVPINALADVHTVRDLATLIHQLISSQE